MGQAPNRLHQQRRAAHPAVEQALAVLRGPAPLSDRLTDRFTTPSAVVRACRRDSCSQLAGSEGSRVRQTNRSPARAGKGRLRRLTRVRVWPSSKRKGTSSRPTNPEQPSNSNRTRTLAMVPPRLGPGSHGRAPRRPATMDGRGQPSAAGTGS
jgi:hypothetical protein